MFSIGCPKHTEHTKHSYRGCFREGVLVYTNICSLWLKRIQSICGNFTDGATSNEKITLSFLALTTSPNHCDNVHNKLRFHLSPEFCWTGLVAVTDIFLPSRTESTAGAWVMRAVSSVTFRAGRSPGGAAVPLLLGMQPRPQIGSILPCTVCPRTGVVLQWVVFIQRVCSVRAPQYLLRC